MWAVAALLAGSLIAYDFSQKKKSRATAANAFDESQQKDWNQQVLDKQKEAAAAKLAQGTPAVGATPPK